MGVQIRTWGPKEGECNICGTHAQLTEDHTPPKGCIRVSAMQMRHVVEHLSAEATPSRGHISQNGVKYRTLCSECNNHHLGLNYDPALIHFVNQVGTYLKATVRLPDEMFVRAQPQKILRAVLGHLSAQGVGRYLKGPETGALRDYFRDTSLPLPKGIRVYYWLYPYGPQVLIRDAALLDLRVGEPLVFWLLKFFPIAFFVTWQEPAGYRFNVHSLDPWRDCAYEAEAELPIRLRPTIHQYWPEAPIEESLVITYGQEAVMSEVLKPRKQR